MINRSTVNKPSDHSDPSENPVITETFNVELVNKNGKKKEVKQPKKIYLILPFTEPKKNDCGMFLHDNNGENKFYAHTSTLPDLTDQYGDLTHSAHIHQTNRLNCNSILCELCNHKRDSLGNLILNDLGYPEPAGVYKKTIESQSDKLLKFQSFTTKLINLESGNNLKELLKFFFSKHQTNHRRSNVFYSLVDKNMGKIQRKNLINTLIYATKTHTPLGIYHVVVSIPNMVFDTDQDVKDNNIKIINILREVGCFGGYIYLHPYRRNGDKHYSEDCIDGSHYHFVGFGHIMADRQKELTINEGIIIKNLHYKNGRVEPVKNVRMTIQYILDHVGVMVYKDRIDLDLKYGSKYHLFDLHDGEEDGTFILSNGLSNFDSDPLPISIINFSNSLNYQKFLTTEKGKMFTILRRKVKSRISEIKDKIDYSKSLKKMSKKGRSMVMRSWGILSNSKNFIWHYKKEKPQFYCRKCNARIPMERIYVVKVFAGQEDRPPPIDPDFPDPEDDINLLNRMVWEEHKEAWKEEFQKRVQENLESFCRYKEDYDILEDPITAKYVKHLNIYNENNKDVSPFHYKYSEVTDHCMTVVTSETIDRYYSMKDSNVFVIPFSMVQKQTDYAGELIRHYYKTIKV
ncbi:hypothetical protein [Cuniculiplasma divulgatum]|uniref:Uncharacterized protein n=1 Tax=Cuniculiplasma divulgatum TaxID=1673428 RepID=A0A1N5TUC6_9ARCH|nr:hypothetical protein [Cuniculiplasma divulgatum]SIM52042.1 hypothetical protein CSP5_0693 [Cuniculiplasma divulgatum]SJK84549.1 hypothetical protein CPM_0690 [Cuniculiplasma divulgatum]